MTLVISVSYGPRPRGLVRAYSPSGSACVSLVQELGRVTNSHTTCQLASQLLRRNRLLVWIHDPHDVLCTLLGVFRSDHHWMRWQRNCSCHIRFRRTALSAIIDFINGKAWRLLFGEGLLLVQPDHLLALVSAWSCEAPLTRRHRHGPLRAVRRADAGSINGTFS